MEYQAIIQSQNGPDGGWLDYTREAIRVRPNDTAETVMARAAVLAGIARHNCYGGKPAFRARIEAWGDDPLEIKNRVVDAG